MNDDSRLDCSDMPQPEPTDAELTEWCAEIMGFILVEGSGHIGSGLTESWWHDKAGNRKYTEREYSPSTKIEQALGCARKNGKISINFHPDILHDGWILSIKDNSTPNISKIHNLKTESNCARQTMLALKREVENGN